MMRRQQKSLQRILPQGNEVPLHTEEGQKHSDCSVCEGRADGEVQGREGEGKECIDSKDLGQKEEETSIEPTPGDEDCERTCFNDNTCTETHVSVSVSSTGGAKSPPDEVSNQSVGDVETTSTTKVRRESSDLGDQLETLILDEHADEENGINVQVPSQDVLGEHSCNESRLSPTTDQGTTTVELSCAGTAPCAEVGKFPSDSLEACLLKFCSRELLTGNNKFACVICTKKKVDEEDDGRQRASPEQSDLTSGSLPDTLGDPMASITEESGPVTAEDISQGITIPTPLPGGERRNLVPDNDVGNNSTSNKESDRTVEETCTGEVDGGQSSTDDEDEQGGGVDKELDHMGSVGSFDG